MLRAIVAFIAGFVAVYAIAMILAVFGYSTVAGLPYEQLLGVMVGGGALQISVAGELRITPGSTTSLAELIMQPMTRSNPMLRASTPPGSSRDRSGFGRPFSGQR